MITCPLCTGFWCGLAFSKIHLLPAQATKIGWWWDWVMIFPFACYGAIVCYIMHLLIEILLNKAYPKFNDSSDSTENRDGDGI
tara:strand:+ start:92 stop:340 length:249 start_codon:yes stop_codon:yes gene_type:complete